MSMQFFDVISAIQVQVQVSYVWPRLKTALLLVCSDRMPSFGPAERSGRQGGGGF